MSRFLSNGITYSMINGCVRLLIIGCCCLSLFACADDDFPPIEPCELPPRALQDEFLFEVNVSQDFNLLLVYEADEIQFCDVSGQDIPLTIDDLTFGFVPATVSDTSLATAGVVSKTFYLKYGTTEIDTIQYDFQLEYEPVCSRGYMYSYQRILYNDSLYYEDQDAFPPYLVFFK